MKTKKVRLMIEAEVDVAEGFTDAEYAKTAVGYLVKILLMSSGQCDGNRGLVFDLVDGQVSYQKPRPILGTHEIIEDDGGVYLLDGH
jgi:hypothetical protein